jgi:hypothetical protein
VADELKNETKADAVVKAVEAPVKAVAEKVEAVAKPAVAKVEAPVAKAKAAVRARRVRKAPAKIVAAVKKNNKRAVKTVRRAAKAATAATATKIERTNAMTYDFNKLFAGFQLPGTDKFQDIFADAGERSQELVAKSQKTAEQFTDLAKANVEALVEAGRIAASGAKSPGRARFGPSGHRAGFGCSEDPGRSQVADRVLPDPVGTRPRVVRPLRCRKLEADRARREARR